MSASLKVLTLNAWGIALPWPFGSKDRRVRMAAIADALATGDWDIVSLQEVWSVEDYENIKNRISDVMPGAFYFHSGLIGSGVCIFTKGDIYATLMHRYSLNGYPHHVHRGDWFGGKVVGLARVNLKGLRVDVYATHLHAEYNKINDLYLSHRVLQAFELSQFINQTSIGDVAIVMGDMNFEPTDLGYQLIVSNACLQDSFTNRGNDDCLGNIEDGATCDVPTNCYTNVNGQETCHSGKRIDYILYRSSDAYSMTTRECKTVLDRIPALPAISYSDHVAVSATFDVSPCHEKKPPLLAGAIPDTAIQLMQIGIGTSAHTRRWCIGVMGILFILFVWTINIEFSFEFPTFTFAALVARFFLTLAIGFCFIYGLIGLKMEQKALEAAKAGMLVLKRNKAWQRMVVQPTGIDELNLQVNLQVNAND